MLTETTNKAASILYEVIAQSGIGSTRDNGDDDDDDDSTTCMCSIIGGIEEEQERHQQTITDRVEPTSLSSSSSVLSSVLSVLSSDFHDTVVSDDDFTTEEERETEATTRMMTILPPKRELATNFDKSPEWQKDENKRQQQQHQLPLNQQHQRRRVRVGPSTQQRLSRKPKQNKKKEKKRQQMQRAYSAAGIAAVMNLRKKLLKQQQRQLSPLLLTEDFRLREVVLYLVLCDVNLLLCQYNNDARLKSAFNFIFASAEIPKTIFPAVRFRMLSAWLEQVSPTNNSSGSNSSSNKECYSLGRHTKEALLSFGAISPVLSSCSIKEMNAYHALCHLKKLPMSVLVLPDGNGGNGGNEQHDNYHDLRNLRNCIIDCARGYREILPYQHLQEQRQRFNFQRVQFDSISQNTKLLFFLISTLPAFLKLTKTQDIRFREVQALLSARDKELKLQTPTLVGDKQRGGGIHRRRRVMDVLMKKNKTKTKNNASTNATTSGQREMIRLLAKPPVASAASSYLLPAKPSDNIWEV